tara:strand:+ start:1475 stop:1708 length:234 start_codon:yes stop_codon:yes gene_type:complete
MSGIQTFKMANNPTTATNAPTIANVMIFAMIHDVWQLMNVHDSPIFYAKIINWSNKIGGPQTVLPVSIHSKHVCKHH